MTKLRDQRLMKAAGFVEAGIGETLVYYALPEEHWRRILTKQPAGVSPEVDPETHRGRGLASGRVTCLNLAATRLRHVAGTEWSTKMYLSMEPMKEKRTNPATT